MIELEDVISQGRVSSYNQSTIEKKVLFSIILALQESKQ